MIGSDINITLGAEYKKNGVIIDTLFDSIGSASSAEANAKTYTNSLSQSIVTYPKPIGNTYDTDMPFAQDNSGNYYLLTYDYMTTQIVCLKSTDGYVWNQLGANFGINVSQNMTLAIDSNNYVHCVYCDTSKNVYYSMFTSSWSVPLQLNTFTTSSGSNWHADIAVAPNDDVWVSFADAHGAYGQIIAKQKTGGIWQANEQITANVAYSSVTPTVICDSSNNPHIFYAGGDESASSSRIHHATKSGSWSRDYATYTITNTRPISLVIDNSNNIYLCEQKSYFGYATSGNIWKRTPAGVWSTAGTTGYNLSKDSSGNILALHSNFNNDNGYNYFGYLSKYTGSWANTAPVYLCVGGTSSVRKPHAWLPKFANIGANVNVCIFTDGGQLYVRKI